MALETTHAARDRLEYELPKAPTGIDGLDDITGGGFPEGRPTLVCGSAGCGKTLLAMEFLVRGAVAFDEPGVFVAFEETAPELAANVRSLGFDLESLAAADKLVIEHVHVDRSEFEENGEYDLDGLFIRLGYAIDSIGAKRIVLDTIENLFGALDNHAVLRAELRRLFRWLKDKGVTAVITAERDLLADQHRAGVQLRNPDRRHPRLLGRRVPGFDPSRAAFRSVQGGEGLGIRRRRGPPVRVRHNQFRRAAVLG